MAFQASAAEARSSFSARLALRAALASSASSFLSSSCFFALRLSDCSAFSRSFFA